MSRSPRSTRVPSATATRSTRPAIGALIVDSIFIASITAIGVAGGDLVAGARRARSTAPITGAGDVAGVGGVGALDLLGGRGDRAVADVERAQLAVDARHHGAHAVLVGFADRLELEDHAHARGEVDGQRLVLAQAVEERGGRQQRRRRRGARCAAWKSA